jgi:hypothetical protein
MGCQKLPVLNKSKAIVKCKFKTGLILIKDELNFSVLVLVHVVHVLDLVESQIQVLDELLDCSCHWRDTHLKLGILVYSCITVTVRND